MPRGPLSSCRPRPWGPPYSGDPVLQGPHYLGCPRPRGSPAPKHPTIPAAPGFGDPLLRGPSAPETHYPGRPSTRGLLLSRPAQARCLRAHSAPTPSSPPRSPGRTAASCISLRGLVAVSPGSAASLFPTLGAGLCPPPSVSPSGWFPSPGLPLFTQSVPLLPAPLSLVFHSPVHSSQSDQEHSCEVCGVGSTSQRLFCLLLWWCHCPWLRLESALLGQ